MIKCEACRAFINFRNELNEFNNTGAKFYLSYDIKITLKSHFWRKRDRILSLCMQCCYGCHNVSRKSVNRYDYITAMSQAINSHVLSGKNAFSSAVDARLLYFTYTLSRP